MRTRRVLVCAAAALAAFVAGADAQSNAPEEEAATPPTGTDEATQGGGGGAAAAADAGAGAAKHRVVIFDFPPGYFGQGGRGGRFHMMNPNSLPGNPLNLNPFSPDLPMVGSMDGQVPSGFDMPGPEAAPVGENQFGGLRARQVYPPYPHTFSASSCTNCQYV